MRKLLIGALLCAPLATVHAASVQLGAGAGVSTYHFEVDGDDFSGSLEVDGMGARSLSAFLGARFNPHLAVELSYIDLGENEASVDGDRETFGVDGFAVSVLGLAPLTDSLSVYGRVGMYDWDLEVEVNGDSFKEDGRDALAGLGFEATFNQAFLRAELTRYFLRADGATLDTDNASLSLGFRF